MIIMSVAALTLLLPLTAIDNAALSQTAQSDEAIFAGELMTVRERDRLRQQIRDARSEEERAQIRDQHRQKMLARAWDEGLNPDNEPIYGGHLLTRQERDQHHRQMQDATSAEERERLRGQHREMVLQRAKERGVKLGAEPVYGGALMSKKERKTYRKNLEKAQSVKDRERIRNEHRQKMQMQAWQRGLNSDREAIYGGHLLTRQERIDFRAQMRDAASAEDRERIRAEHHGIVETRARDRGENLGERPIYGGGMLNNQQLGEYRQMMQSAQSAEEREQLRATHRELMQRQAWERGVNPGKEPIYGGYMMSPTERAAFRQQMQNAGSAEERATVRAEHRAVIRERATANGMGAPGPAIFGGRMMSQRERQKYQKRLADAETADERRRIMEKHMDRMRDRARDQPRDGTGPGMDGAQMRDRIERGLNAGAGHRGGGRKGG